jgi:hypothetical protein
MVHSNPAGSIPLQLCTMIMTNPQKGWIAVREVQIAMEKRTFDRKAVCVLRFFNDLYTQTMEGRLPKQPLA